MYAYFKKLEDPLPKDPGLIDYGFVIENVTDL